MLQPNNRRLALPGQLSDPRGGTLSNKLPDPIPWDAFVSCGLRVLDEGKPIVVVLDPQHTTDPDETLSLVRLLLAMSMPKPGPIAWETVPAVVQRHFKILSPNAKPAGTEPTNSADAQT